MAIADTITSMQTHTSNAYTMIGYGTNLTGINKNLENLSNTIFEAFLEALRTPDTLFTNLPKKSGTGTNITLNDTANAPMRIMLNATELTQAGTPTPSSPQAVHTISGSNIIVVNGKNLLDTSYLVEANADKSYQGYGFWAFKLTDELGTFTLSRENNTMYSDGGYLAIGQGNIDSAYNNKSWLMHPSLSNLNQKSATKTNTGELWLFLGANSTTIQNTITKAGYLQLEKGNTATTYEPYISQEAEVDLSSKNLAYTGWASDFVSRINNSNRAKLETFDNKNCLKWSADAGYPNYDTGYMFKTNWKENTQYTIIIDLYSLSTSNFGNICVEYTDGTLAEISGAYNTWVHKKFTSASGKTIKYIRPYYRSGGSYIDLDTFMVYEGTKEIDYVPYYTPIEYCKIGNYEDKFIRTSGKNLFDANLTTKNCSVNNQIIKITASATDTYIQGGSTYSAENKFLTLPAGTYYLKSTKSNVRVQFYGDNASLDTSSTQPITLSSATNFGGIRVRSTDSSSLTDVSFGIMLSTENIDYEPYGSNEWYIKKNIGKVVLDGTETWVSGATNTDYGYFYTSLLDNKVIDSYSAKRSFCNKLKWVYDLTASRNVDDNNYAIVPASYNLRMAIDKSYLQTVDATGFKTWLASNNITIYCPLAISTYTKITGTLETQLENVYKNMLSQKGQTNISQINNDLSFNMSVQAIEEL